MERGLNWRSSLYVYTYNAEGEKRRERMLMMIARHLDPSLVPRPRDCDGRTDEMQFQG